MRTRSKKKTDRPAPPAPRFLRLTAEGRLITVAIPPASLPDTAHRPARTRAVVGQTAVDRRPEIGDAVLAA